MNTLHRDKPCSTNKSLQGLQGKTANVLQLFFLHSCLFLTVLFFAVPRASAQIQTTLQIIHNAPETTLSPIAVWTGIPLNGNTIYAPVTQSLSYRSATPSFSGFPPNLPSLSPLIGIPLITNITRTTSTNGSTEIIRGVNGLSLSTGANFVLVMGLADSTNYAPNPQGRGRNLNLNVIADSLTIPDGSSRLIYVNGCTDSPPVDIVIRDLNRVVVNNMGYLELVGDILPTADYTIDVYNSTTKVLINSFRFPLFSQFNGSGRRFVIMASGFANPAANRNGPSFGLLAVPHLNPTNPAMLEATTPPALNPFLSTSLAPLSLQAVHASADPAASSVGVWLGAMPMPNTLQFFPISSNFPFRSATPTVTSIGGVLPLSAALGMSFNLNITPANQTTSTPALRAFAGYSLQRGGNWAVAEGVIDTTRFARNPDGRSISLTVRPMFDTISAVSNSFVQIRFINSVTDSPTLEYVLRGGPAIGPFTYGLNSINATFPLADYIFDVRQVGTTNVLGSFRGEFLRQNLGGKRVLIAATGFISPARNQGGQSLGMLVAVNDSTGRSFMMPTLALSVNENAGLTVQSDGMTLHTVSPNPVRDQATVSFTLSEAMRTSIQVLDIQGRTVWASEPQFFASGKHSITIDAQNLAQGTYIIRMSNEAGRSVLGRMSVVR